MNQADSDHARDCYLYVSDEVSIGLRAQEVARDNLACRCCRLESTALSIALRLLWRCSIADSDGYQQSSDEVSIPLIYINVAGDNLECRRLSFGWRMCRYG